MKMNKTRFFVAIASLLLLAAGCAMNDVDNGSTPTLRRGATPVFTSSFENAETRTYVDSDLYMYWTADDRLTIFTTTYNQQYRFDGQTGANGGSFSNVNTGQLVSGNPISTNYGVYPYNASTALTKEEKIELELPAVQQYAVNSFGMGANTMVAVTGGTDDFFLPFKNVCGYLVVKLYGDVTVKKVIFEGNNGEKIAGAATVVASHNANPEITMSAEATTSITVDCGEGVELGKTADTATEFWFVIPPTTFYSGFTIKAIGGGAMQMTKSTTASRTIQRNVVNEMSAIELVFDEIPIIAPEIVDLGLSVKWASCNVGASKPQEWGGCYAWGETETKSYYDWSTYKWCNGSINTLIKYCNNSSFGYNGFTDAKTVLDEEDDVAHVMLGGKWRMPTDAEWAELRTRCVREYTTYSGVRGIRVTGPNGNSIFLPTAGSRYGYRTYTNYCFYWSSSLYTDIPYAAFRMPLEWDSVDGSLIRCYGLPVRPVCD